MKEKPIRILVDKSFYDLLEVNRKKLSEKSGVALTHPKVTRIMARGKMTLPPMKSIFDVQKRGLYHARKKR